MRSNSGIGSINSNRINDRIANLLNNTKEKKCFRTGFFTSKATLAYT